jgi:hypothetical protein
LSSASLTCLTIALTRDASEEEVDLGRLDADFAETRCGDAIHISQIRDARPVVRQDPTTKGLDLTEGNRLDRAGHLSGKIKPADTRADRKRLEHVERSPIN